MIVLAPISLAGQDVRIAVMIIRETLMPKWRSKPDVLGGDDRLPQHRRHVVVADDHAALDREFANLLTVAREQARDGVWTVVVEGADLRQVAGIREQNAAQGAERGGDQEEENEDGLNANLQHEPCACTARLRLWSSRWFRRFRV